MAGDRRANVPLDVMKLPKGMMAFKVTGPMIKDSTNTYCDHGELAALTEEDAKLYHDRDMIKVELPDFEVPKNELPAVAAPSEAEIQARIDAAVAAALEAAKNVSDDDNSTGQPFGDQTVGSDASGAENAEPEAASSASKNSGEGAAEPTVKPNGRKPRGGVQPKAAPET